MNAAAISRATWSKERRRQITGTRASAIEIESAISRAVLASTMVAGSRETNSSVTGCPVRQDVPRSPWSTSPSQWRYRSGALASRWCLARKSSTMAGDGSETPRAINTRRAGSPSARSSNDQMSTLAITSEITASASLKRKARITSQVLPCRPRPTGCSWR